MVDIPRVIFGACRVSGPILVALLMLCSATLLWMVLLGFSIEIVFMMLGIGSCVLALERERQA